VPSATYDASATFPASPGITDGWLAPRRNIHGESEKLRPETPSFQFTQATPSVAGN
jgi:hypothetical protein